MDEWCTCERSMCDSAGASGFHPAPNFLNLRDVRSRDNRSCPTPPEPGWECIWYLRCTPSPVAVSGCDQIPLASRLFSVHISFLFSSDSDVQIENRVSKCLTSCRVSERRGAPCHTIRMTRHDTTRHDTTRHETTRHDTRHTTLLRVTAHLILHPPPPHPTTPHPTPQTARMLSFSAFQELVPCGVWHGVEWNGEERSGAEWCVVCGVQCAACGV